jgi:glutathione S-transferase
MKLFVVPGSPNVRKCVAVVHHLELPVEMVQLDFASGDLRAPEYQHVNPNGLVPSLVDGDLKLWESNAIMQYLASQRPNELFPADARARADIARWQFWESNHLNRAVASISFERVFKPMFKMGEPDTAAVEQATAQFHRFAPVLEAQLTRRRFVVGDQPTLADFSIAGHFMYADQAQVPLQQYEAIRAWYERMELLPSWRASSPMPRA